MTSQSIWGNQNVQIRNVHDSLIRVTYQGEPRDVPLERATVPVSARARSPTRLVQARSGVVPYAARKILLDELEGLLNAPDPFAAQMIGGHGGSGKTRIAVELCERAEARGWLCGFLSQGADPAALEVLVGVMTPRLIVVDYAESRVEQLELLLPLLAVRATLEAPVRVLLLVRADPSQATDWSERLRNPSSNLSALLDECEVRMLEDAPLITTEREALFIAAARAFADRLGPTSMPPEPPGVLAEKSFASPLLVVIAAYLAVHGNPVPPSTRAALLDEVLVHERRYMLKSAPDLFSDDVLPRRVVGLATLAGAKNEADAAERLRLLPDLVDASAERRTRLARWVHEQYPGPRWWNPLEPDLVGEHLVANIFADQPGVLAGVLAGRDPEALTRPLEVYARAAADHPQFIAALKPILSAELSRICEVASAQAMVETDHDHLYGNATTAAAAIERAITAIEVDACALAGALSSMPLLPNLVLSPLLVTLGTQHVAHQRRLAATDPPAHEAGLAFALNFLSNSLADVGRHQEGLALAEEAVEIYRRLAGADPAAYDPGLAGSLNNLSIRLVAVGRPQEGLATAEEAVEVLRRLPDVRDAGLAIALSNLSNGLAAVGRHRESLVAIKEAVEIYRRLPDDEPGLAGSLSNLSIRLANVGRPQDGLAPVEEAVKVYRRLATASPAAYEPELARSLHNLSHRLAEVGRSEEGLAAIREAVEVRRRLADTDPAAYEPDLARSLNGLSTHLAETGHREGGLVAIEEAVEIYHRLADTDPTAYEPGFASSLNNLSIRMVDVGRHRDGLAAIREAVEVRRRLADTDPAAYEPDLARSLGNLSNCLADVGRPQDGLAPVEEAVGIHRRLADTDPAAYEPDLARSLGNLSNRLAEVGRPQDGLAPIEEAVGIVRRLFTGDQLELAVSLNNLSNRLAEVGRPQDGLAPIEEAVEIHRRLVVTNPAAYESKLAGSLHNLSLRLAGAQRPKEGLAAMEETVQIYRRLATAFPAAYESEFTSSLTGLSNGLEEMGRHEEAEAARRELANFQHNHTGGASPTDF